MRSKFIKGYLYVLPLYSLFGIVLSVLRTAYQDSYASTFLLVMAILDLIVILVGYKYVFNKYITLVFTLLIFSLVVGLLNNELSRRFLTDFSNPFFFFCKIFIFKKYWDSQRFQLYIKYYTKVTFIGSAVLLPIVYYLFNSTGSTRLAIFPPMELPFSNYVVNGNMTLVLVSFIIILLYGKRAQLVSAFLVFLSYIVFFNRKKLPKYIVILIIGVLVLSAIFSNFSENLAVKRITTSIDLLNNKDDDDEAMNRLTAGRYDEVNIILNQMDFKDYLLGKGMGFTYVKDLGSELKEVTNAHFSPLGFISKYGILFTLFIYLFLFRIIVKGNKKLLTDKSYLLALGVVLFIFFESFFAYAMFVTPIFPLALGYIMHKQDARFINL